MADLGRDLKDYLSKSRSESKENGGLISDFKESKIGKWFNRNDTGSNDSDEIGNEHVNSTTNGWFTQAEKDPFLPNLSRTQRAVGFVGFLAMGTFCIVLAGFYAPFLILKSRKFAMLYTLGSLFYILSFSFLWGPWNHVKHLFSMDRLPFTAIYFGSMFATIYFSIWAKSTLFTIICAFIQIFALLWFLASYIPGGKTGMKFFGKLFSRTVSKGVNSTLPV